MAMPLGNDAIVRAAVPAARCMSGDWWERLDLGGGIATTLTRPTIGQTAGRATRAHDAVEWALSGHAPPGRSGLFGDTGYGDGVSLARCGTPGITRLGAHPDRAYAPTWFMAAQHVDPADAVRIFNDVGAGRALGIHWGTFQLTDEARDAPVEDLATALRASRIAPERFVAAQAGGVYRFA